MMVRNTGIINLRTAGELETNLTEQIYIFLLFILRINSALLFQMKSYVEFLYKTYGPRLKWVFLYICEQCPLGFLFLNFFNLCSPQAIEIKNSTSSTFATHWKPIGWSDLINKMSWWKSQNWNVGLWLWVQSLSPFAFYHRENLNPILDSYKSNVSFYNKNSLHIPKWKKLSSFINIWENDCDI